MTQEQQILFTIKGVISELPPAEQEATHELARFIQENVERAGSPVGALALALVGAERAAQA